MAPKVGHTGIDWSGDVTTEDLMAEMHIVTFVLFDSDFTLSIAYDSNQSYKKSAFLC